MAVRAAGVRLEHQLISKFLTDAHSADDAWAKNIKSVLAFAEAEKRATATILSAEKQRAAAATAESKERQAAAEKNIQAEKRQTATLRAELQQRAAAQRQATREAAAAQRAASGGGGSFTDRLSAGVAGGIGRSALGLGLGFLGIQGAQQALQSIVELDRLRGQAVRTQIALTSLAGGGVQASAAIRQIQSVAPGASSELEAAGAATVLLTQKLNSSAVSLGEIARATSIIPQVSSSIRDQSDAIGQLTLFGNSASFARADQLAVRASDVQARVKELAATYPELDDAQLKVAATVQLINERFDALGDAAANNVTGIESLSSAFADLRQTIAGGAVGAGVDSFFKQIADGIRTVNLAAGGGTDADRLLLLSRLVGRGGNVNAPGGFRLPGGGLPSTFTTQSQTDVAGGFRIPGLDEPQVHTIETGADALQRFKEQAEQTITTLEKGGSAAAPFLEAVRSQIDAVLNAEAATNADVEALIRQENSFRNTALAAADFTQVVSESTKQFLDEQAGIRQLAEARAQIDALAKSSLDLFAGGAPGADELSESLIELQTHLAGSTQLSEEDAAAVGELEKVYRLLVAATGGSVDGLSASEQAKLNDAVAAYEDARAHRELKAALDAVRIAQAGVSRGIVSTLSGLVGSGTINQGQALAIERFQQQQAASGFANIEAQGLKGSALAFATADLQRTIEAPLREWEQVQKNITTEAHAQHQASQGASKEWNKAQKDAEKAAKATRQALESVEGLFGASKVTQGQLDIAEAGGAINLPDDFLRRFRDVSENFEKNGFREDFGQEQLNEARAALERIGVQPLDDLKGIFAQFEEAWANSSLFSAKENLALINKQAVEDNLKLQQKMEEGRKNIFEMFGVAIDDSVEAISGGGSTPFDQEALNAKLAAAEAAFWDKVAENARLATSFNTSGVSLSDQVRGGTGGGLQDAVNGFTNTADILRGTFEGVTTTADILREAFGRVGDSTDAYIAKQDAIPQLVWQGDGGVIDTFPNWKGEEGIIPEFPGWEAWLGTEKAGSGPATPAQEGTTTPGTSDIIRESMTQPSTNTTSNTKTTTVTISSTQSTGSLVQDWAVLQAQGAV